jgi:Flp pilus assembly protein TadD
MVSGKDPVPLLNRTIQLDPDFASAWFTLARIRQRRCQDSEAEQAISRAFALRGRTSERERLAIEALYHQIVTGDAVQAIAVTKLASHLFLHDSSTWRWSVLAHCSLGEIVEAMEVAQREVKTAPYDGMSYFDVAVLLSFLGRTDEARAMLMTADAHGVDTELFSFLRYVIAALDNDAATVEGESESARGKASECRLRMLDVQTAAFRGQLDRARQIAKRAMAQKINGAPALIATVALAEAIFGLEREPGTRAKEAVQFARDRRTAATTSLVFALVRKPVPHSQRLLSC